MASIEKFATELYRLRLLTGVDELLAAGGFERLAGVDEAGRGCLAGPVVAAAVLTDPARPPVPGVDDSKALTPELRAELAAHIRATAVAWAVADAPAETIDRINILEATRLAMMRALVGLAPQPDCAVVDAVPLRGLGFPCLGLVKGDALSYAVACASILAKVERDRLMRDLDKVYPHYGFAQHKGYAAPEHLEALRAYGPCAEHRLSFHAVVPREGDEIH